MTQQELDRAKADWVTELRLQYAERDQVESSSWAQDIVEYYLGDRDFGGDAGARNEAANGSVPTPIAFETRHVLDVMTDEELQGFMFNCDIPVPDSREPVFFETWKSICGWRQYFKMENNQWLEHEARAALRKCVCCCLSVCARVFVRARARAF